MSSHSFDVVVIGKLVLGAKVIGGAIGFKTVIIEREHMGGICLELGRSPTKALLRPLRSFI